MKSQFDLLFEKVDGVPVTGGQKLLLYIIAKLLEFCRILIEVQAGRVPAER